MHFPENHTNDSRTEDRTLKDVVLRMQNKDRRSEVF